MSRRKIKKLIVPEGMRRAGGDDAHIVAVDENDPMFQAATLGRRCGDCVNWDREACQRAMLEQKFVERLVHQERWREHWLEDYANYGVCWAFSDSHGLAVWPQNHETVIPRSHIDSSLAMGSAEGSEKVLCPYYENRKDRGRFATASAAGVRGPSTRDREAAEYVRYHDERRKRGKKLK